MGSYKDIESEKKYPVVCIYGESGNGKTTFAKMFADAVLLDGDSIRKYVNTELGYSMEDRRMNNMIIAKIATMLYHQGQRVVISSVRADLSSEYLAEYDVPFLLFEVNKNHKIVLIC